MHVAEHHFLAGSIFKKALEIFHYPTRGYSTTRLLSSLPYPTLPETEKPLPVRACSSQPITLLLSSQQITEYDQFCTMDAVQKSENETESSGKEMQNIKTGKSRRKTGEGRVDKQGVHEWTNRVCN